LVNFEQAAESEVSFADLEGGKVRIGIIRTRWNEGHVNNLVKGIRTALDECKVAPENIFETSVPGSYELPIAARFLALSGTVDAIICTGVLIKGETLHFEYIADAVSKGIMNVAIQTSTPCIFGVLTCLNEQQVKSRSSGNTNHGYDWGKTAVEMALLRIEALGQAKAVAGGLGAMGFASPTPLPSKEGKDRVGFF
jgi:6,7-dimethyl-8-ribityllumazine synthase